MIFNRKRNCRPPLEQIYRQVHRWGGSLHYAGLGILCKDLAEYLATRGLIHDAIDIFRGAFGQAINQDRRYFAMFWPEALVNLSELEGIPSGMANLADQDNFDLPEAMGDHKIVAEWNRFLGWAFFREYHRTLQEPISKCLTPDQEEQVGEAEDRDTAITLAECLLGDAIPDKKYWYPLVLYFCLLVHKTNNKITMATPNIE